MKKIFIFFTLIFSTYALESFTALLDNDMFLSDKWYTNGLEFKQDNYFFDKSDKEKKYNEKESYVLGQRIYTPSQYFLGSEYINDYDRPFAGYLYFGKLRERYFEDGKYNKRGWLAEITGDASLGAFIQRGYHRLLNFAKPMGWETQIENIYGAAYVWEDSPVYKNWNLTENLDANLRVTTELHLGNVMLYGRTFGTVRFGNINSAYEFSEKENNKKFLGMDEYYLALESGFMLKGHDSTLQGDIFNNGSRFTLGIYPLVFQNKAGLYAGWDRFAFSYDLIMQSTESRNMGWSDNGFRYHTLKFIFFR